MQKQKKTKKENKYKSTRKQIQSTGIDTKARENRYKALENNAKTQENKYKSTWKQIQKHGKTN